MLIKTRLVKFAATHLGQALVWLLMAWLLACGATAARAQTQTSGVLGTSPETALPVYAASNVAPLVMLIMSRDHSLFYPAYNNWSDLDGDGKIDKVFNPDIEYQGIFNPYYCYRRANSNPNGSNNTNRWQNDAESRKNSDGQFMYEPNAKTSIKQLPNGKLVPGSCPPYISGNYNSGNWLNWATMSRMDVVRVALYGGMRDIDTASTTVLRRAYIPQDGHAWGGEYVGANTVDRHMGLEASPYANPTETFANLSRLERNYGISGGSFVYETYMCWRLTLCASENPLFRTKAGSFYIDQQYTAPSIFTDNGQFDETLVRVKVCIPPDYIDRCKEYKDANGNSSYKPVGILQQYGETGQIKFGLITGSYDSNLSGGILRKNISDFSDEIDPTTGVFKTPNAVNDSRTINALIITQINNIAIRNFNNNYGNKTADSAVFRTPQNPAASNLYSKGYPTSVSPYAYKYKNTFDFTRDMMNQGNYSDWGNPIAEMMYEGLRYFKGESSGVFDATITSQADPTALGDDYSKTYGVGLRTPAWQDPYSAANVCAKPNLLVISGPNSFDSDQLPGASFSNVRGGPTSIQNLSSASGVSLNVTSLANTIGADENIIGTRLIGQTTSVNNDYAPTAKPVSNLGEIRGLAPDGANSDGSYYAASVAKFGKEQRLRSINDINIPTVDTYALQFSHDVPMIKIPVSGKIITIMPFGKTLNATDSTKNAKGQFQATNQIIGAQVTSLTDPLNAGGTFSLEMYVNFDNSSWGGDHAMHAVAQYTITANASSVSVKVQVVSSDNTSTQNLGYIVSGSSNDGVYLVATSATATTKYFLNVPDGQTANYCLNNVDAIGCDTLATFNNVSSTKTFTPSDTSAVPLLKDPLWYAAKWGGYADGAKPTGPTSSDPSNFADLTNPAKLYTALPTMLDTMLSRGAAKTAVTNSQQAQGAGKIFTTAFDLSDFSGVLTATSVAVSQGDVAESINYSTGWNTSLTLTSSMASSRSIYFKHPTYNSMHEFNYTNLDTLYSGKFSSSELVNYLRGDASGEKRNSGNYRNRSKTLGMTVNSVPVYSADTGAVYVAANDGMLHAFDAATGREKFAYVPSTAITSTNNLGLLASPDFSHRYFIDGNIAVSNKADNNGGANYLVGFMGRAAKGLFGMEVNNTSLGLRTDNMVWELGANDDNMGYLLGKPLFTKLQNGDQVIVFGNGYNSTNNNAVLYVVWVNGSWSEKLVAQNGSATAPGTSTQPNGLATPTLVTDSNGRVQYAYAGDYLGNVWKFDLNNLGRGTGASGKASLVFKATVTGDANKTQPITAPVTLSTNSASTDVAVSNKQFLFFGTGSDLTASDVASTQKQSMYGLMYENSGSTTLLKANLRGRSIDATTGTDANGYSVRSLALPGSNDMNGKSGWYMDWSASSTSPSEKVTSAATVRAGTTPYVVVSSNMVNRTACGTPNDIGYVNVMDAYHGGGLATSALDLNRNGSFTDETFSVSGVTKVISSINFGIGVVGQVSFSGNNVIAHGSDPGANGLGLADAATKNPYARKLRRVSWREIVK